MRLVVWNGSMGWSRDLERLRSIGCDIGVLSEVPADPGPDVSSDRWLWTSTGTRGLALAALGESASIEPAPSRPATGDLCVAGELPCGLRVLGIWANPPKGELYALQVERSIEVYADWLTDAPGVIAGDFNVSGTGTETEGLQRIIDLAERLGYVSLYHEQMGEAFGEESTMTYFHQRRLDRGFHIDYCFVHRERVLPAIELFQIGGYDEWVARHGDTTGLSDHVPMVIDLDLDQLDADGSRSAIALPAFSKTELDQYAWTAERDVDLVLSIALKSNAAVSALVRLAVGADVLPADQVRHSSGDGGAGETDVQVTFADGLTVLIENKLNAPFQENQPGRYRERADRLVASDPQIAKCCTVLLAPAGYLAGSEEVDTFDGTVTYEDLRDVLLVSDGPAMRELALIVEHAIRKHRRGTDSDDGVGELFRQLFQLAHSKHGFPLPKGLATRTYGRGSPWLWLWAPIDELDVSMGITGVAVRAELPGGTSTLFLQHETLEPNVMVEAFRAHGESSRRANKSVAIVRTSQGGPIDPNSPLESQQPAVDSLLATAAELRDWWVTSGRQTLLALTETDGSANHEATQR